jgi:hypothetical protein
VPVVVELAALPVMPDLGWTRAIRSGLDAGLADLLTDLGLPGRPQVRIAGSSSAASPSLRVHDKLVAIEPTLAMGQPPSLVDGSPPQADAVVRLCLRSVQRSAGCLLGQAQLDAWLEPYGAPDLNGGLLAQVLRGLLDLGIAIGQPDVVVPRAAAALAAGMVPAEVVELLFARLRPPVVEVHSPPGVVDDAVRLELATFLDETVRWRTGVRLPPVTFVDDSTLRPASVAARINHVLGTPMEIADVDWPASMLANELLLDAYRLVGCLDVEWAIAQLKQEAWHLARAVLIRHTPEAVTKVLRELLREGRSIADLASILERLARFDVVLVDGQALVVLDDRLPVVATDRDQALADWRNQLAFVREVASPI